ncbi:MAG: DUF1554 domain-containing protein [SAR324 cluster bacterium]|nr:DUF1554 domain-containing protein [SAR324 cluster bacterium]
MQKQLIVFNFFLILMALVACSEEGEPCNEYDPFCSRVATAKLSVDDANKIVLTGEDMLFDASDSTYDEIKWYVDGAHYSSCQDQEFCKITLTDLGTHKIQIKTKVNATGAGLSVVTQGLTGNSESKKSTYINIIITDNVASAGNDGNSSGDSSGGSSGNSSDYPAKIIFVTSSTYKGNQVADSVCSSDANYPGNGTYKALITTGVLASEVNYVRTDSTLIGSIDSGGWFNFPLDNAIDPSGQDVWTGLTSTGSSSSDNCSNWSAGTGGSNGTIGDASSTSSSAFENTTSRCNTAYVVYCVEQ